MKESRSEGQFGQLVVMLGFASPVAVSECVQVQKSLAEKGEKKPLGQILVEKGVLNIEQVRQVLLRQGKTLLVCTQCKSKFNLADPYSGDLFKCRICNASVNVVETPDEIEGKEKADPLIGMTIAGCRISEQIGEDGVTRSYRAWQVSHQRDVVIRILKERFNKDKELIKQFLKRAAAGAKVRHPSVIPIHDVGQAEGYFYICHGYVEGRTLRERIEEEGRFPVRRAVANFLHIVNGVEQAHKTKTIHRDLRPGNIIYPEGKQRPVIAGFGFVKRAGERAEGGELGIMHGSPDFMAPEQIKNYSASDERSDVFSLCALLFYMLVGESPFSGDDPVEVLAANLEGRKPSLADITEGLPKRLCDIVDKGLSRHPDQRFRDASELKASLETIEQQSLPLDTVKLLPRTPSLEGISEEALLEEKEYSVEEKRIELAPPVGEEEKEELRLADEEMKPVKAPYPVEDEPLLSEKEKAEIIEEALARPEPTKGEVSEGAPPTTPPEAPAESPITTLKRLAKEKKPLFVLSGVGALILIVILVLALSGGEETPVKTQKEESRLAYERLRSFIATVDDQPERFGEVVSRCREYLEMFGREKYAKEVKVWLSEFERKEREEKIKTEWSQLQSAVEEARGEDERLNEVVEKLEEFARKYPSHPLSNEANELATKLREERTSMRAEELFAALKERVERLCREAKFGEAKADVERGLPPDVPTKHYEDELRRLRDYVLTEADRRFERVKAQAKALADEGKVEEALQRLSEVKKWGLPSIVASAERQSSSIMADFKKKLWVRRMVAETALEQARIKSAEAEYGEAKKVIEETLKDGLLAENYGKPLKDMLLYIVSAKKFNGADIEYLKKQVGLEVEFRTTKGILVKGVLKEVDGTEMKVGDYPPISIDEIPYKKRCEFARLALGGETDEALLAEASFRYFRGEVDEAFGLLAGKNIKHSETLMERLNLARFFKNVTRNRLLFSGIDTKRWKTQKSKLAVKELEGEDVGVLLCQKKGSFYLNETVLKNYILRFHFRFPKPPSSLVIELPYDEKNSVHLILPDGEGTFKVEEAKARKTLPVRLYPDIWYEMEVRFIDGRYRVFLDGRLVLETANPVFSEIAEKSRLSFSTPEDGWMFKNILLLEAP